MAKDKDRTLNPAAAHLKTQKTRALKKSKAQQATQRNEKLARRNPDRLQRQIDDLKATQEAQSGQLRPRDKQHLEQLERDVKAIRKAREAAGLPETDKPPRDASANNTRRQQDGDHHHHHRQPPSTLGKRRRGKPHDGDSDSEATDPDVRSIPMPHDTPPPIPRRHTRSSAAASASTDTPTQRGPHPLPAKPTTAAPPKPQTTYESAPQLRDLTKEATARFVPAAVAARLKHKRGDTGGRLLEPEEVDALERGGYLDAERAAGEAAKEEAFLHVRSGNRAGVGAEKERDLDEEERAFERELAKAEAEDEGGDTEREALATEALRDAENVVDNAVGQAQHNMVAEEAAEPGSAAGQEPSARAEKHLRHVEIEEVEDEALRR